MYSPREGGQGKLYISIAYLHANTAGVLGVNSIISNMCTLLMEDAPTILVLPTVWLQKL